MDSYKAMSDPTRRMILKLLNKEDLSAGDIAKHFEMSKPAVSKHLDILRNADLISSEKKGQFVIYSINTTAVQNFMRGFMDVFEGLEVKVGSDEDAEKI